ncbi:MAG TPA: UpxY family transcription antiterminator [Pedobacter sp.]|uniref:UpxY family transcription antiterminator n=1 Tax=Pedobacter sp. TaxID=1411316 RepID=UPI002B75E7EA|nr:UpxY family transcription antiterminator [Pedobacter sp.]HMI01426.1 UpxY family transcription antiterminator [Pedobacter sp.]
MIRSIIPECQATSRSWKVVYTRSMWERKTTQLLIQKGIHAYCPLVRSKRKWADRMKTVEIPLFSSYIFVHVNLKEELEVLQAMAVSIS